MTAETPAMTDSTNAAVQALKAASVRPAAAPFTKKLDYLPSLKKAIVMSEILSPPKALRQE